MPLTRPTTPEEAEERLKSAFVLDDFGDVGGEVEDFPIPDKKSFLKTSATSAWAQGVIGSPVSPYQVGWQGQKDGIVRSYFNEKDASGVSDDDLFSKIAEDYKAKDALAEAARNAAARGESWQLKFREVEQTMPNVAGGRQIPYLELAREVHDKFRSKILPYQSIIKSVAEKAKSIETSPEGMDWSGMAQELIQVPKESRPFVLEAISRQATANIDANAASRLGKEFARGFERFLDTAMSGSYNVLAAAGQYSEIPLAPETPQEIEARKARESQDADLMDLRDDIRDISTGKLAKLEDVRLLGMNISGAARNVPMTIGAFVPYIGPAALVGSFQRETANELRRANPTMSRETIEGIATISAPFQALTEVVSDRLLFGKLPNLKRLFTTPVFSSGGIAAFVAGRAVMGTATEYAEEFTQGAVPKIVQSLSSDVPDVDWDGYFQDFKDQSPELLATIIPLALFGAGVGQATDYRASVQMLYSADEMMAAKIPESEARKISELAATGKRPEAESLFRQEFRKAATKGEAPAEMRAAAQRVIAANQAQRQVEEINSTEAENLGVRVFRDSQGWKVETAGGNVINADSAEASRRIRDDIRTASTEYEAETMTALVDDIVALQPQMRVELRPEVATATSEGIEFTDPVTGKTTKMGDAKSFQNLRDQAEAISGNQSESARLILGDNYFEFGEGIARVFRRARGTEAVPQAITAAHEVIENSFRRGLIAGQWTENDARNAIGSLLPALESGITRLGAKVTAEERLWLDNAKRAVAEGDSNLVREVISEMGVRTWIGRDRDGNKTGLRPGTILRALDAAILQEKSPENVTTYQRLRAWFKAVGAYLKGVVATAKIIRDAERNGTIDDFTGFLDKVLGIETATREENEVKDGVIDMAFSLAPELKDGSTFSLAGPNAEIPQFMRDSLVTAQAMAAEGKDSETIRAITGWFPGKYDGKMRWEIPDNEAEWIGPTTLAQVLKLSDAEEPTVSISSVLRHPSLLAAYPGFFEKKGPMKLAVSFTDRFQPYEGQLLGNIIEIGKPRGDVLDGKRISNVLLHEIQHWIQEVEGYAKGSSPDMFALLQFSKGSQAPYDAYMRTAGEIESRDVQARQSFTPEQRKAIAPYSSENIAKDDAIVIFGDTGSTFSLAPTEQDREYLELAKNPEKNRTLLQKMVDAVARAAGYEVGPVWHGGTSTNEFSTLRPEFIGGEMNSFLGSFFAEKRESAERFAVGDVAKARGEKGVNRSFYLKAKNPESFKSGSNPGSDSERAIKEAGFQSVKWTPKQLERIQKQTHKTYGKDVNIKDRPDLAASSAMALGLLTKRDAGLAFRSKLKQNNIDSVFIENDGNLGPVWIVPDPSQIKSADPVTYDDAGNIIPLSQRFNAASPDIRFSLSPQSGIDIVSDTLESWQDVFDKAAKRNPTRAMAIRDLAQQRINRLGEMWAADKWTAKGDKIRAVVEKRTKGSLDDEQAMREALTLDQILEAEGMNSAAAMRSKDFKDYEAWQRFQESKSLILSKGEFTEEEAEKLAGASSSAWRKAFVSSIRKAVKKAKAEAAEWRQEADDMQADDWSPRESLVRDMRVLNVALSAFPPEVRAKITGGSMVKLAGLATERARYKAIQKALEKAIVETEVFMRKEYTGMLIKTLDKAAPIGKPGEVKKSKFIVTVQDEIDAINEMVGMDHDDVATAIAAAEAAIITAQTPEDADAKLTELNLLELFGGILDIKNTSSQEMASALEYLENIISQGRDARKMIDEARRERVKEMVNNAKREAYKGDSGPETTQAARAAAAKKSGKAMLKKFFNELSGFDAVLRDAFGPKSKTATEFSERFTLNSNRFEDVQNERRKRFRDFARELYRTKLGAKINQKLITLERIENASGVTYLKNRTVKTHKFTEEEAARIVADPKAFGFTEKDAAAISEEIQAIQETGGRRKVFTYEQVENEGDRTEIPLSQMDALYLSMALRQPGILEQQQRYGYDQETVDQLEKFLTDDAKRWRSWMQMEYDAGYNSANEVYMRMFNTRMPKITFYAPLMKNHQGQQAVLDPLNTGISSNSANPGSIKTRKARTSSLRIESAFSVFWSHFNQMEYWNANAEYLRDVQSVMLNPEVREAVVSAHGEDGMATISAWVQLQMSRGVGKAALAIAGSKMFRNVKSAISMKALALNLSTTLKTIPSVFYSLGEIHMSKWPAALVSGMKHWDRLWKTNIIQRRLDIGGMPELRDLGSSALPMSWVNQGIRYGSHPTMYADGVFTTYSAAMAYGTSFDEAKRQDASDAMAHKYAEERTALIVSKTAQPENWTQKSLFENDASGAGSLFFMFTSDPRQKLALAGEALNQWRKGSATTEEAMRKFLAYWVIPGIMFQLANAIGRSVFKGDDDEWEVVDFATAALVGQFQGLALLGSAAEIIVAAAIAGAAEKITGKEIKKKPIWNSPKNPLDQAAQELVKSVGKITEEDVKDGPGKAWEITKSAGMLLAPLTPAGAIPSTAERVMKDTTNLFYGADEK